MVDVVIGVDTHSTPIPQPAEPGRLLASGHPDLTDTSQPINLGLIESRHDGRTWTPVSLSGAADFHALGHTPTRTWAIDATTGGLLTSVDERAWRTVSGKPLLDLAVDPTDPDRVLATTGAGQLLEISVDGDAETRGNGPSLGYLHWPASDVLVGVDAHGTVHRSTDGGHQWHELARVTDEPTALTVIDDMWYVATSDGLFRGDLPDPGSDQDNDQGSQVTRLFGYAGR